MRWTDCHMKQSLSNCLWGLRKCNCRWDWHWPDWTRRSHMPGRNPHRKWSRDCSSTEKVAPKLRTVSFDRTVFADLFCPSRSKYHEKNRETDWMPAQPTSICDRSEEHTSELQSLMRISYAVLCLKQKKLTELTIMHTIDTY